MPSSSLCVVLSTSLGHRPWTKRDSAAACVALATGAHGGVPPGLLPPVAVSDLDRHGEGEKVQPAPRGCRALPAVCLYADSQVLGLSQKGHWPSSSHCQ